MIKLTKRGIDALPAATNPRGEKHYDTDLRGFGLTAYPTGRKSFFIEFGPKGRRRRMTLGAYGAFTPEQARQRAKKLLMEASEGGDPLEARTTRKAMPTFSEWAAEYLEGVKRRKKRPDQDIRYLSLTGDRWGKRPLDEISRSDVKAMQQHMAEKGHTTANRWLASVRSCLETACDDGKLSANPAMGVKPYRENPPRSRVLTDDELKRVLGAVDEETDIYVKSAFYMLIETGGRKSEVLGTRWEDIDFEGGLWRIPSPKAGHPQVMPLPASTLSMLHILPRIGEFVFPGRDANKPRQDLKCQWARIREAVGIPDVRIHDVRRTFGLQVARTAGLHVASKLLRHSDIRVTESVYAPLGIEELREAMETRTQGKVLPFRKPA